MESLLPILLTELSILVITWWAGFSITVFIGTLIIKEKLSFRDKFWALSSVIWVISSFFLDFKEFKYEPVFIGVVTSYALSVVPFFRYWFEKLRD